jgi:hypothetical protein
MVKNVIRQTMKIVIRARMIRFTTYFNILNHLSFRAAGGSFSDPMRKARPGNPACKQKHPPAPEAKRSSVKVDAEVFSRASVCAPPRPGSAIREEI